MADVEWSNLYNYQLWYNLISRRLEQFGPIAVGVKWFESYSEQEDLNGILQPTADEVAQFQANPRLGTNHVMTLAGEGVDENGIAFWEMQDSDGNVDMGDRDFHRCSQALFPQSLIMHVRMDID